MVRDDMAAPSGRVIRHHGEVLRDGDYIRDNLGLDWRFRGVTRDGKLLVQAGGAPGAMAPASFPNVTIEEG